jgi:hypothetical protein
MSKLPPLTVDFLQRDDDVSNSNRGPVFLGGWDRATLGDYPLPGRARVTGANIKLKRDQKNAPGKDGSRPTYHGLEGQEFTLEVQIWTDQQAEALANVCAKLLPRPGEHGDPIGFDHPSVRLLPITKVKIVGATALEPGEQRGMYKMGFRLEHWLSSGGKKDGKVTTPERAINNDRRKRAEKKAPPNPLPSTAPTAGGPK